MCKRRNLLLIMGFVFKALRVKTTLLLSININNYTLVEELEIEFSRGTTAITGETGAGKSLVLDALSMALVTVLIPAPFVKGKTELRSPRALI